LGWSKTAEVGNTHAGYQWPAAGSFDIEERAKKAPPFLTGAFSVSFSRLT